MKIVDSPERWDIWEDEPSLPVIPPLPKDYPNYPNKPVAKCGECGRLIYGVEMYSCPNQRCPVQPKVWC